MIDALCIYIVVEGIACKLFEKPKKMILGKPRHGCRCIDAQILCVMLMDVFTYR